MNLTCACGKEFEGNSRKAKFCPACKVSRKRATKRRGYARKVQASEGRLVTAHGRPRK